MNKIELIDVLQKDLKNEYTHFAFYLRSAILVEGLHREELSEFFEESAKSEMQHIIQFSNMIGGLGSTPDYGPNTFISHLTNPKDIVNYALILEEEVINNYAKRMDQIALMVNTGALSNADGKWLEAFLENQIVDSRTDADHLRKMLKGLS